MPAQPARGCLTPIGLGESQSPSKTHERRRSSVSARASRRISRNRRGASPDRSARPCPPRRRETQYNIARSREGLAMGTPSIVPHDAERDTYLVLDDLGGRLGWAWRETDAESADRATL